MDKGVPAMVPLDFYYARKAYCVQRIGYQKVFEPFIKYLKEFGFCVLFLFFLTACGGGGSGGGGGVTGATVSVSGTVQGGAGPIGQSSVSLWEAASTGGTATQVSQNVQTNPDGSYTLTSSIPVPASAFLYVVASGGNVSGTSNPNIMLMSTVGEANNIPSRVFVNEFTTVVSSYLFLTGSPHFSSGVPSIAGNSSALVTAQNSLVNYVNLQNGLFQTSLPSSSVSQLTDLANIIASCVEDTSGGFSNCQTLKTATTVPSVNPSNTLMSFVSLITQLGNISAQNQADLVNLANTPTSLSSGGSLTSLNGSTSIPQIGRAHV